MVPEILKLESFLKVHHLTSVIRGKLKKDKKINIYAGCGIVFDSNPEEETNELKWKLLPLIDSLK